MTCLAAFSMKGAGISHGLQLFSDMFDAGFDAPAIHFKFGFTGPPGTDTAGQSG